MSLACYAIGAYKPRPEMFDFEEDTALTDATGARAGLPRAQGVLARGCSTATARRRRLCTPCAGRIRFDEQIRRRFGVPLPIEVRYDEYTDDILANRLVKAAASRLGAMRLRSPAARRGLGWIAGMLENVAPVEFPPNRVPDVPVRPAERPLPRRRCPVPTRIASRRIRGRPGGPCARPAS